MGTRDVGRPPELASPLGAPSPPPGCTNERILRAISTLYAGARPGVDGPGPRGDGTPGSARPATATPTAARTARELGLRRLCAQFGVPCDPPRRKVSVLLLGTHSSGKSSFVNWYVGEQVQTTGVAVETQGISLVTSGRRRESLGGQATLQLYEALAPLGRLGAAHALSTEVCASRARLFPLLTFIDTPGLVDGGFEYAFAVEDCLDALARHADLVLLFFDPHSQALCDRMLRVVRRLCEHSRAKLRPFLSKADAIPTDAERSKVLVQLTQTLTSRTPIALRELPCIYLPTSPCAARSPPAAAAERARAADVLSLIHI